MDERIDRKFEFGAINPINGKTYSEKDGVVFLAKDNAVPATLRFYREECERQGAALGQLEAVDSLVERIDRFRLEHPELCKVADVSAGEIEAMRDQPGEGTPEPTEDPGEGSPEPAEA